MVREFRLRNPRGYATITAIRGGSVSTGDNSGSAGKQRLAWIDFSKGLCMVLVVLYHLSLWMETEVHSGPGFWWVISDALNPLRMPLFFFISGYLSISALRRPLGSSRSRTIGLYYVYVLWTGLVPAAAVAAVPLNRHRAGSGATAPEPGAPHIVLVPVCPARVLPGLEIPSCGCWGAAAPTPSSRW